jgi:glucose/arabinose dehydrogenase
MRCRRPRRLAAIAAAACLVAACGGSSPSRTASASALVPIGAGLAGPAGLVATVYARGLPRVAAFAFDPQGRLWVATADSTDAGKDGLYLVARSGAAPVEVVSGLRTPLGLLWYQGSLFVSATSQVDAFSNFNGTAFLTRRTVVTFPAGVGESNALALAPDGRIWMGISAPCDHCVTTSPWSASVVSFLPDGSSLRVEASGIRAPVGLAFYPGTDDLLVTMDQRDDLGTRTPGDALSIVRSGDAWHFPTCYEQGGAPCAGVPQPVAVLDQHGAVSDVAVVTGQLGASVGTSALVAEWAVGKVQRVVLTRVGTGLAGTVEPFLTGVKNPVAVVLGPDDALYVGDWTSGTVYRITAR